jgi:hypothetical protein
MSPRYFVGDGRILTSKAHSNMVLDRINTRFFLSVLGMTRRNYRKAQYVT